MSTPERPFHHLLRDGLAEVLRGPAPELTDDTLLNGLGLDSVGVIELVGYVETAMGIEIRDDELAGLRTVRDLGELVARTQAEAG